MVTASMVIAKLFIKAGKGIVLDKVVDELFQTYHTITSQWRNHQQAVNSYNIPNNNYFSGGNLREIAKRYGLEGLLTDYSQSLFDKIKGYLAELGKRTQYLGDVAQKRISLQPIEVYVRVRSAYNLMTRLLGINSSEIHKDGYISDLVNNYLNRIGDLNSRLDRFLSVAEGFNTDGSGIIIANAKRVARFVAASVLERNGIPSGSIDKVVSSITKPFAELRKQAKPLLATYADVVKNWQIAYAADISTYASRDYALAA